jgi:ABC-2 type transport system permease protein
MHKIWQIIKYEYTRHVFRKRFLISLLSLPLLITVMVVVALVIAFFSIDASPLGYVDDSGILDDPVQLERKGNIFEPAIDVIPFQDEEKAKAALENREIQAYYVIPQGYPESRDAQIFYYERPDGSVLSEFRTFMQRNLIKSEDISTDAASRLFEGSNMTLYATDGSKEIRDDQWYHIFTPFIAGIMFIIIVMTSGGYLLQAVVEEKENRTMEIVITSVSPGQLMTGKIIGNINVGLTQLVIWLLFGWLGLKIGGSFLPVLNEFSISADYVILLLLVLLPSFVMVAAIMASIGATMTETREAQQVSGMFSIPIMIPYYLASTIMMNPNGTLAVILSYFPLTAPITILMRATLTVIPTWQIVLNLAILFIFAGAAIWFAGRAFRIGMLQYGKKLSIKEVLRKREQA